MIGMPSCFAVRFFVEFDALSLLIRKSVFALTLPATFPPRASMKALSSSRFLNFSTLPVIRMADAMRENGVPGVLSLSAGLYVCNDLYYRVLHHFHNTGVRAAFIHVPAASGTISMDSATAARALTLAIEQIPME